MDEYPIDEHPIAWASNATHWYKHPFAWASPGTDQGVEVGRAVRLVPVEDYLNLLRKVAILSRAKASLLEQIAVDSR